MLAIPHITNRRIPTWAEIGLQPNNSNNIILRPTCSGQTLLFDTMVSPLQAEPQSPTVNMAEDWDKLPAEAVGNIMRYLKRKDLKACRLVDKRTSHEASRMLFHTICFAPSMTSVKKICEVARDPRLASYVRCMEVHRYPIRYGGGKFENQLDPSFAQAGKDVTGRMKEAYENEVEASETFLRTESDEEISQLWGQFAQLQRVVFTNASCHGEPDCWYLNGRLDEDSDIFRRTGVRKLRDLNNSFAQSECLGVRRAVTQYLNRLRPPVFEARSMHWQDCEQSLIGTVDERFQPLLLGVRKLQLTMRNWHNWYAGASESWGFYGECKISRSIKSSS